MAENYDVGHYCKASSPDALKPAQEYFGKCVPVILEGLSGINDKPQDWLRAVDGITGADEEPMKKRLFFVHVDVPVIAPSAVAAHEADLDAIVAEGKRRRLELPDITASESDLTPTTAGNAYVEAMGTPGDSDDDDDVPDNAASASSSDASQLPAGASGPHGPDGKPLFARLPEFVAVYLVFATDVLVRMGEMPGEVHQYYLAALRSVQPNMAHGWTPPRSSLCESG